MINMALRYDVAIFSFERNVWYQLITFWLEIFIYMIVLLDNENKNFTL